MRDRERERAVNLSIFFKRLVGFYWFTWLLAVCPAVKAFNTHPCFLIHVGDGHSMFH